MSAFSGIADNMQGLAEMRVPTAQRDESELEVVAGHFEALFTRMMLKTMRESSLKSDLFESNQNSQYTEMFDDQVAMQMSRGRGLGLKQMLIQQLQGAGTQQSLPAERIGSSGKYDWKPTSNDEFVSDLMPFARQVEKELGVSHKAVLAQAALESGWGRHAIRKPDGSNSFNLFGIKADSAWNGDRVATRTLEVEDGVARRTTASFRSYQSLGEAARDYADFIRSNPRYSQAIEHGSDPHAYAQELQRAGYATDPDYAKKIGDIIDSRALRITDANVMTDDRKGVM